MQKLESLNGEKFKKFEENKIENLSAILAGERFSTGKDANGCTDTAEYTNVTLANGSIYKSWDNICWDCSQSKDTVLQMDKPGPCF